MNIFINIVVILSMTWLCFSQVDFCEQYNSNNGGINLVLEHNHTHNSIFIKKNYWTIDVNSKPPRIDSAHSHKSDWYNPDYDTSKQLLFCCTNGRAYLPEHLTVFYDSKNKNIELKQIKMEKDILSANGYLENSNQDEISKSKLPLMENCLLLQELYPKGIMTCTQLNQGDCCDEYKLHNSTLINIMEEHRINEKIIPMSKGAGSKSPIKIPLFHHDKFLALFPFRNYIKFCVSLSDMCENNLETLINCTGTIIDVSDPADMTKKTLDLQTSSKFEQSTDQVNMFYISFALGIMSLLLFLSLALNAFLTYKLLYQAQIYNIINS